MQKQHMEKRMFFAAAFLILLVMEVLIAMYVHDSFVRPYIGDVLVVIVLYCFVRIWLPKGIKLLPLWIFMFAAAVEISQLFHLVDLLGLGKIRFFRVLIGSVFDGKDILCYAVGCAVLAAGELACRKRTLKKSNRQK